jgi:hypothetical protein
MTIIGDATIPPEYVTNTDESDALALNMAPEIGMGESVSSAVCELTGMATGEDAAALAYPAGATVTGNVVTQIFDARPLEVGSYRWIWNVTLNTGALRSYRTILRVRGHD